VGPAIREILIEDLFIFQEPLVLAEAAGPGHDRQEPDEKTGGTTAPETRPRRSRKSKPGK
jgi:hypothetical protein